MAPHQAHKPPRQSETARAISGQSANGGVFSLTYTIRNTGNVPLMLLVGPELTSIAGCDSTMLSLVLAPHRRLDGVDFLLTRFDS